jgi:hypothetical protein
MTQHCAEEAELYALGLTDPERSASIEEHCAICEECRTSVIAAEATAAALAAALPAVPAARTLRRPQWTSGLAAAAAVVFAVTAGFEGTALHSASQQSARTDAALIAVAGSHFAHTTLTSPVGSVAKVLYSRDGSWLYVIADGVGEGTHVMVRSGGGERDLGALGGKTPATLFVREPGRVDEVVLTADGRTLAHGVPAY